MHDVIHLILDCCNNLRVSAAGIVYGDSCVKVKVWCAILIIQIHALGSLSDEIETLIGLNHVLLYFVFDVLCC